MFLTKSQEILVFDIETVRDLSFLHKIVPSIAKDANKEVLVDEFNKYLTKKDHLRDAVFSLCKEEDGFKAELSFPRQLFHKVAVIGCLKSKFISQEEGFMIENLGIIGTSDGAGRNFKIEDSDERERIILGNFIKQLEKVPQKKLVSFNGKGFDLPVLRFRAMKHRISSVAICLYEYEFRYKIDLCIDLMELLTNFKTSSVQLVEVCAMLGIPCKANGIHGDDVQGMFDKGNVNEIQDYCETDVLATFILYVNYIFARGLITLEGLKQTEQRLRQYLISRKNESHIEIFLNQWEQT